jgi:protocatechuate 3,4-dioxygenase beta subunit
MMRVLETNDPVEARRCRRAQYGGYPKEVAINGSKFFGIVRSVTQEPGRSWVVTIIPTEPKVYPLRPYRPS